MAQYLETSSRLKKNGQEIFKKKLIHDNWNENNADRPLKIWAIGRRTFIAELVNFCNLVC